MNQTNTDKIILDLCGGTGSWSKPYRDAGYDVRLITLPNHDVRSYTPPENVYGILAAPPCTMFSRARSTGTPRDLAGAMHIVQACLEIIWLCRSRNAGGKLHGGLQFWALENPMGLLRQFLGNPPHSFRGWEFGDDHVKFTDLWGYYRMPTATHRTPRTFDKKRYAAPRAPEEYRHLKLDRAGIRAITPQGFAQAFFRANR